MRIQLPPPKNWDDFESLALQLWKSLWADHNAQMHGRRGQAQHGVDIFGRPFARGSWEGVQCKGKEIFTDKRVTVDELNREVTKARGFSPSLSAFVIATTGPRDGDIQRRAAELTSNGPFRVSVWGWDDIEEELNFRDYLLADLYPQFSRTGVTVFGNQISIYRTQPMEKAFAFLSHAELRNTYPADMRVDLKNLIFEIALNAFQHGDAHRVNVTVEESGALKVADDGRPNDPLQETTRALLGAGSLFLGLFRQKYRNMFSVSYDLVGGQNTLTLSTLDGVRLSEPFSANLVVFEYEAWAPDRARYIARTATIPTGYDVIDMHISSMEFTASSLWVFLSELLSRVEPGIRFRVFCGSNDLLAQCLRAWNTDEDGRGGLPFAGRFIIVDDV
jgi:hypothetical protein